MKKNITLGQRLAWTALLAFIASLFLPMETNSMTGSCAWPCTQPFVDYGWQNAIFFVLDLIVFPLKLLEVIYIAAINPLTLPRVLESTLLIGMYAIMGLGEILIALAPFWPARIQKPDWNRLHLSLVGLSTLSVIAYGVFPSLRLGLELLKGYYLYALSFLLMLLASILIYRVKTRNISTIEGEIPIHIQA